MRSDLRSVPAVIGALHLPEPCIDALGSLADAEWRAVLDYCDRSRITLALRGSARRAMPEWVRERTDSDLAKNRQRLQGLRQIHQNIATALDGLDYLLLKGFTQPALSGECPENRVQYDVDLYAPPERAAAVRDRLLGGGYEPLAELEDFPTDHFPPLIRKTGWEWRGDFFDPEIPAALEVHFRFWNAKTERLSAPGVEEFWERRISPADAFPGLHPVDGLGYTALHLLRHVLRGNPNAYSVYELALMLDRHAGDDRFWSQWQNWHSEPLRRLEAVSFDLARRAFGCRIAPAPAEAIERLPAAARAWLRTFGPSALTRPFRRNKDELWLHLSLLESAADRASVARRRLFPSQLPGPVDAVYLPAGQMSWRRRCVKQLRYARYLAQRALHHVLALPRAAFDGAQWWWSMRQS